MEELNAWDNAHKAIIMVGDPWDPDALAPPQGKYTKAAAELQNLCVKYEQIFKEQIVVSDDDDDEAEANAVVPPPRPPSPPSLAATQGTASASSGLERPTLETPKRAKPDGEDDAEEQQATK